MTPPAHSSGEVQSPAGVTFALARQGCAETVDPDQPAADLVEERLEVRISNGSPQAVTVQRDKLRLLAPDGSLLETVTWGADKPITVPSGQDRTFKVRYMAKGGIACDAEMRLDARQAVAAPDHAIRLGGISFVPRRAL